MMEAAHQWRGRTEGEQWGSSEIRDARSDTQNLILPFHYPDQWFIVWNTRGLLAVEEDIANVAMCECALAPNNNGIMALQYVLLFLRLFLSFFLFFPLHKKDLSHFLILYLLVSSILRIATQINHSALRPDSKNASRGARRFARGAIERRKTN